MLAIWSLVPLPCLKAAWTSGSSRFMYCWSLSWRILSITLLACEMSAVRDWGQEEKGSTEDEMTGWHHQLNRHEFEWTPGVGDGQGGLVCCNSWSRKELDTTEWLNWTEINNLKKYITPLLRLVRGAFPIPCLMSTSEVFSVPFLFFFSSSTLYLPANKP